MKGYKLFYYIDGKLVNEKGRIFELSKKYVLNGTLKYGKNGFYFCEHIEETLRFATNKPFVIVEVNASGEFDYGDTKENEICGIETAYVSSEIEFVRIVPREELFNIVINSRNPDRVKTLVMRLQITDDEAKLLLKECNNFESWRHIMYYHYHDEFAYYKTYEDYKIYLENMRTLK